MIYAITVFMGFAAGMALVALAKFMRKWLVIQKASKPDEYPPLPRLPET